MAGAVNQVVFSVHDPANEFLSVPAHVGTARHQYLAKLVNKSPVYLTGLIGS
jgi:hypothetical protein